METVMKHVKPHFIKKQKDVDNLFEYLEGQSFNAVGYQDEDRRGNRMVKVYQDWKPDSDYHMPDRVATIIVINDKFFGAIKDKALELKKSTYWWNEETVT